MATSTIGTSARNYSTVTAWEAALTTGSQVGECYNDSVFSENWNINDADPDDITLQPASGEEHDGTPATGVQFSYTSGHRMFRAQASNVVVTTLNADCTDTSSAGNDSTVDDNGAANSWRRILVRGAERDTSTGATSAFAFTEGGSMIRCVVFDSHAPTSSAGSVRAASIAVTAVAMYACNNTVFNLTTLGTGEADGYFFGNDANIVVRNNLAMLTTTEDFEFLGGGTSIDSDFNASEDATADDASSDTSSLVSITAANQLVSTAEDSEDPHVQDADADLVDAGEDQVTTPAGVNIDLDGRDVDSEGDVWDIGAHELVAAGQPFILRMLCGQAGPRFTAGWG